MEDVLHSHFEDFLFLVNKTKSQNARVEFIDKGIVYIMATQNPQKSTIWAKAAQIWGCHTICWLFTPGMPNTWHAVGGGKDQHIYEGDDINIWKKQIQIAVERHYAPSIFNRDMVLDGAVKEDCHVIPDKTWY